MTYPCSARDLLFLRAGSTTTSTDTQQRSEQRKAVQRQYGYLFPQTPQPRRQTVQPRIAGSIQKRPVQRQPPAVPLIDKVQHIRNLEAQLRLAEDRAYAAKTQQQLLNARLETERYRRQKDNAESQLASTQLKLDVERHHRRNLIKFQTATQDAFENGIKEGRRKGQDSIVIPLLPPGFEPTPVPTGCYTAARANYFAQRRIATKLRRTVV